MFGQSLRQNKSSSIPSDLDVSLNFAHLGKQKIKTFSATQ